MPLIKFTNLTNIYLQNNPINDISKLNKFVFKLKCLSLLDLSETLIEKSKTNMEIIDKAKKINEEKDIKIII